VLTPTARLTWLGHSTVLLELDGARVVTDPLLMRRAAHLWRSAPLPDFDARADVVAVSHMHWDHFDTRSLARLAPGAVLVVPRGAERLVRRLGFAEVVGVHSGDTVSVGGIEIRATYAEHQASRRWLARAGSVGFVFEASRRVFFAGDTDLFDGMRELAGLDLALLPISGWGLRLPAGHLDARKAVRALELLEPRAVVPIHWGTFAPLGLRALGGSDTAVKDFVEEAARRVPDVTVHVLPVGGSLAF
jgi:L-ascorbate metabolism protein UlaG (beta-lactamase superfamily)